MQRVLQVNLYNRGGAFSVVSNAGHWLTENYVFDYYSPDPFDKNETFMYLKDQGSRLYTSNIKGNKVLKQIKQSKAFYEFLKVHNYDIVHIHTDTAWKMWVYLRVCKNYPTIKFIAHSHSSGINGHYKVINLILHLALRKTITKNADVLCACSKQAAKWMYGNKAEEAVIVTNGINLEKCKYNPILRCKYRKQYAIKNEEIVLCTVGDFSWTKNINFLVRVFSELKDDKRYKLLFIGEGNGRSDTENRIAGLGLENRVFFTGQITNVNEILNCADYFLLPSHFEGIPMSALEAQANGLVTFLSQNIAEETKCSKYCHFLSIDESKIWKDRIKKQMPNIERMYPDKYIVNERVDSKNTAQELFEIYNRFKD